MCDEDCVWWTECVYSVCGLKLCGVVCVNSLCSVWMVHAFVD